MYEIEWFNNLVFVTSIAAIFICSHYFSDKMVVNDEDTTLYPIIVALHRAGLCVTMPATFFHVCKSFMFGLRISFAFGPFSHCNYTVGNPGLAIVSFMLAVTFALNLAFLAAHNWAANIDMPFSILLSVVMTSTHVLLSFGLGTPTSMPSRVGKVLAVSLNMTSFICFWISIRTPYSEFSMDKVGMLLHAIVLLYVTMKFILKMRTICSSKVSNEVTCTAVDLWLSGAFMLVATYFWASFYELSAKNTVRYFERMNYIVLFAFIAMLCRHENSSTKNYAAADTASDGNTSFVRFISHELLSHLNHLNLGLQILVEETPREESSKHATITDLQDTCDSAQLVMNEIAMLSELQSTKNKSKKALSSCGWALKYSLKDVEKDIFRRRARLSKDIELSLNGSRDISQIRLHLNMTDFAYGLRTLLRQAVKASPPGETVILRVRLHLHREGRNDRHGSASEVIEIVGASVKTLSLRPKGKLRVEVIDKGMGFSEDDQAKLFHSSSVGNLGLDDLMGGQGSGLGLPIVQALVHRNGGTIAVHSPGRGQGSTFTIDFPVYEASEKVRQKFFGLSKSWLKFLNLRSRRKVAMDPTAAAASATSSNRPSLEQSVGHSGSSMRQLLPDQAALEAGELMAAAAAAEFDGAEGGGGSFFGSESRIAVTAARVANILSADVGNSGQESSEGNVESNSRGNSSGVGQSANKSSIRQIFEIASAGLRSNRSSSHHSRDSKQSQDQGANKSSSQHSKDSKQSQDHMAKISNRSTSSHNKSNSSHSIGGDSWGAALGTGPGAASAGLVGHRGKPRIRAGANNSAFAFSEARTSFTSAGSRATMPPPTLPSRGDSSATLVTGLEGVPVTDQELEDHLTRPLAPHMPSDAQLSLALLRNKREILLHALTEVCIGTSYSSARLFLPSDEPDAMEPIGADEDFVSTCERDLALQVFRTGQTRRVVVHDAPIAHVPASLSRADAVSFNSDEKSSLLSVSACSAVKVNVMYTQLRSYEGRQESPSGGCALGVVQLFQQAGLDHQKSIALVADDTLKDRSIIPGGDQPSEAIEVDARTTHSASAARIGRGSLASSCLSAAADDTTAAASAKAEDAEEASLLSVTKQLCRLLKWVGVGVGVGVGSGRSNAQFRFLLVDDNGFARKQLRLGLETLFGPHCTSVGELHDGADVARLVGVAAQKNLPFDAVFLDWMLQVIDGPSAVKALRASGYRGQIVSILATQAAAKEAFSAAGVEAVLEKPVSQAALLPIVAKILLHKEEDAVEEAVVSVSVRPGCERLEKIIEVENSFLDSSITQRSKRLGSAVVESSVVDVSNSKRSIMARMAASADLAEGSSLDLSISQRSKKLGSAVMSDASSVASNGGQKMLAVDVGGKSGSVTGGAGGSGEGFRFLVVDDVSSVRKVIAQLLKKNGQDAVEAEDGVDALEAYKKSVADGTPFDCVLMDFVMPHMDGPTATKEMRSLGYKGLVLGVTGNVLPSDVEHFMAHGANRVIPKPLKADMLKKIVEELRRRRRRGNMSKQSVDQPLATATVAALATATGLSASVFNPSRAKVGVSNDAYGFNSSVLNASGLAAGQEPPAAGADG